MAPRIGITMSVEIGTDVGTKDKKELFVSREHSDAILWTGGLPYFLPFTTDEKIIEQYVEQLDGLLLTGGWDLDPHYYGEDPQLGLGDIAPSRDETEIAFVKAFLKAGKPILGICRGHQVLAVVLGCTLFQDLDRQYENVLDHHPKIPRNRPMHSIQIKEGSILHEIYGQTTARVNSMHHQAVKDLDDSVIVTATSSDGVIEAIESKQYPNVLGVQFHPECMADEDPYALRIFRWLVERSKEEKEQRKKIVVES